MVARLRTFTILASKLVMIIPMTMITTLAIYSYSLPSTLMTTLLFFFILVPLLAFKLCCKLGMQSTQSPLVAMASFYGWIIFLIHSHYKSDFFLIMILSAIYNLFIIMLVMLSERDNRLSDDHST